MRAAPCLTGRSYADPANLAMTKHSKVRDCCSCVRVKLLIKFLLIEPNGCGKSRVIIVQRLAILTLDHPGYNHETCY